MVTSLNHTSDLNLATWTGVWSFEHFLSHLQKPLTPIPMHTHSGMEKLKATVWKCKQAFCSLAEVTEGVLKELFPFIFSRLSLFTFKRTPETGVVTELYLGLCSHTERRKINFSPRRTVLAWLDGLGAGSLSTLLHCTSSGGEGGLETLALTGEEKDEACTSHRINTRNSGGEAPGASVSNVEPRTSVCT